MNTMPSPIPHGEPDPLAHRSSVPSWISSVVLHALIVILLGLCVSMTPQGSAALPNKTFGIVLAAKSSQGKVEYYDESTDSTQESGDASDNARSSATAGQLAKSLKSLQETSLTNVSDVLPQANQPIVGIGKTGVGELMPEAGGLMNGPRANRNAQGGKASTSIFGVTGTDSTFVYVFDRSLSMQGAPMQAAQNELIHSLESLADTHQFQIIFYNQDPSIFNPAGGNRLSWATSQNQERAKQYIRGVTAAGGTHHEKALLAALSLSPDVIFFLTDADQPRLEAAELETLRRRNSGRTSINTIEFGLGPAFSQDNFLSQLARQNGGRYGYVDITTLSGR